jgi:hypothetical protein
MRYERIARDFFRGIPIIGPYLLGTLVGSLVGPADWPPIIVGMTSGVLLMALFWAVGFQARKWMEFIPDVEER